MRAAVFLAAVAPSAIASAIPGLEEPSAAHSFDKREDITSGVLGGKILSTDLYAGIAGLNQQLFQATQKGDQWKKCNPLNIVVRREWYIALLLIYGEYRLTYAGLPFRPPKRRTTSPQCNVLQNFHQKLPSLYALGARIAMMISSRLISSKHFLYVSHTMTQKVQLLMLY
jgi:hypothetical protein